MAVRLILLLLLIVKLGLSRWSFGSCPKVKPVDIVGLLEIQGLWFESAKFYSGYENPLKQCTYMYLAPPYVESGRKVF